MTSAGNRLKMNCITEEPSDQPMDPTNASVSSIHPWKYSASFEVVQ